MIEKISSQKATTDEFLHQVALKLNEVIEAVNDLQIGPALQRMQDNALSFGASPWPSVPEAEPPEQDIIGNIRRLLQLPEPDLAVLYREDALKTRRYIPYDDSEIEMLRHLIHVELDRLAAAQPGKGV
jgi:hypothetical protein